MNFIEMCIAGTARPDQVDDYVDHWHDGPEPCQGVELREFLGMSKQEYADWACARMTVEQIIEARRTA